MDGITGRITSRKTDGIDFYAADAGLIEQGDLSEQLCFGLASAIPPPTDVGVVSFVGIPENLVEVGTVRGRFVVYGFGGCGVCCQAVCSGYSHCEAKQGDVPQFVFYHGF